MNKLSCFLIGLLAVAISLGIFHLWVRLWNKILDKSWTFKHHGDSGAAHIVVLAITILAVFACIALYYVGCGIRESFSL